MEIETYDDSQIKEIMRRMDCPKDFRCYKTGFSHLPEVEHVGGLLECFEGNAKDCPYAFSFGLGYFCRCQLNRYIHDNLMS